MREFAASKFYNHTSYAATYYAAYIGLENFISNIIFRQDSSRIFLSSDKYAFRRRTELISGSKESSDINLADLDFPFANYSPINVGWKPITDGSSSNSAAQVLLGLDIGDLNVKSYNAQLLIPVTFYFDREDDARLAYDALAFLGFKENYFYTSVGYKGKALNIPLFLKLNNCTFNPTYNETDWLSQNRIYSITASFSIRSIIIAPPRQQVRDDRSIDDTPDYYLTEKVILELCNHENLLGAVLTATGSLDEGKEAIKIKVSEKDSSSALISWDLPEDVSKTIVYFGNQKGEKIDPPTNQYRINDLGERSTYTGYVEFYYEDGTYTRSYFSFTTNASSQVSKNAASLIGASW